MTRPPALNFRHERLGEGIAPPPSCSRAGPTHFCRWWSSCCWIQLCHAVSPLVTTGSWHCLLVHSQLFVGRQLQQLDSPCGRGEPAPALLELRHGQAQRERQNQAERPHQHPAVEHCWPTVDLGERWFEACEAEPGSRRRRRVKRPEHKRDEKRQEDLQVDRRLEHVRLGLPVRREPDLQPERPDR